MSGLIMELAAFVKASSDSGFVSGFVSGLTMELEEFMFVKVLLILSIWGAVALFTVWAFRRTSRHAREMSEYADRIRDLGSEIAGEESDELLRETRDILRELSKIGPSSTARYLVGVNYREIAARVEKYAEVLKVYADQHGEESGLLTNLCSQLPADIHELSTASSGNRARTAGTRIYSRIETVFPVVKRRAVQQKDESMKEEERQGTDNETD